MSHHSPFQTAAAGLLDGRRFGYVDIGARHGLPPMWQRAAPLLDVIAFEPDETEARTLHAVFSRGGASVEIVPSAVWDSEGTSTLYITRSPGCSSLYRPRTDFIRDFPDASRFDVVKEVEVRTVRLDSVAGRDARRPVRFIKIDAQGGALNILGGAPSALHSAVGLEIEVEMAPLYDGEPLFGAVDEHVRERGFELVDLRPVYWRKEAARHVAGTRGQVIWCDALYLLRPQAFVERLAAAGADDARHLMGSVVVVADVYGLPDWITAYASAAREAGLTSAALLQPHVPLQGAGNGRFPLRNRAGVWLKNLADRLIESRGEWAAGDQRLGNRPRMQPSLSRRLLQRFRIG